MRLAILCASRRHCVTCRATAGDGPAWRASMAEHYAAAEGWACPHGLPWDWRPAEPCDRCGASWHATAECPIDPNAQPTARDAVAGGCACSPPAAGDE